MTNPEVLIAIAIAALVQIPALAVLAALSDRVGRRTMYVAGSVLTALWAYPLFWLADTG